MRVDRLSDERGAELAFPLSSFVKFRFRSVKKANERKKVCSTLAPVLNVSFLFGKNRCIEGRKNLPNAVHSASSVE